MIKQYFKEIIIILLLILAIALVLGVFLYDYIPTSKIVPIVEPYEIPSNIKEELEDNVSEDENNVIVTYEIDEKDLNNYEKEKDYQKGKINPFSSSQDTSEGTTVNTGSNSTSNTGSEEKNNSDNNENSGKTETKTTTKNTTSGLK